jgi:DNA-directed RNA polymerase I, II, and III subunit RPABC5
MIIPVRCFTCGSVIGNKYKYYKKEVTKMKRERNIAEYKDIYITKGKVDDSVEKEVLDSIGLRRMCCRRHLLAHVDIMMDSRV